MIFLILNGIILLYVIPWSQADIEIAWLEDTNGDHDKRNLYRGLQEALEFNLKRDIGNTLKLQLQENKRLNPNAPVYKTVIEDGTHKVVKLDTKRIMGSKYYIDKKTGAAVQVSCVNQALGPCRRVMEGILEIDGHGYEIRPSSAAPTTRSLDPDKHVPHEIERHVPQKRQPMTGPNDSDNVVHGVFGTSFLRAPGTYTVTTSASEDNKNSKQVEPSLFEEIAAKLRSFLITNAKKSNEGGEQTAPHNQRHNKDARDVQDERGASTFGNFPPRPNVGIGQDHPKRDQSEIGDDDPYLHDYLLPPDTAPLENERSFGNFPPRPKVETGKPHLKRELKTEADDDDPYLHDYLLPPDTAPWENERSFGDFLPQPDLGTGLLHLKRDLDTAPWEKERSFGDFLPQPDLGTGLLHLKRDLETKDDNPFLHDYLLPPDTGDDDDHGVYQDKENETELRENNLQKRVTLKKYTVETLVVIDPFIWKIYFDSTTGNNGMNQDEATMYRLRQRMAMLMNGVNLRYATIEDPEIAIYFTISGYVFCKENDGSVPLSLSINIPSENVKQNIDDVENDGSAPLPLSVNIPTENGKQYVDDVVYISNIASWVWKQKGLPNNDLVMVMTSLDLYYHDISKNGVAGIAYTGVVCGHYRVSVQEDAMFYDMVSVVAHELAHNLGSSHDGSRASADCPAKDHFIMDPYLKKFYKDTPYTRNPWLFSDCTVNVFKTKLVSASCLGNDNVVFYDKAEYDAFNEMAPGEVFSPDDQCRMVKGEASYSCKSPEDESICLKLTCRFNNACYFYTAAFGTPCGVKSHNKWCYEGKCVSRPGGTTTQAPTTTTQAPTTTTTKAPTTTIKTPTTTKALTTTQKQLSQSCVNIGWKRWSCGRISKYFKIMFDFSPSYWCHDPYWSYACCALCAADAKLNEGGTTTTEAPTTTKECVDKGYSSWSCNTVSAYFKKRYGILPQKWCLDPDWGEQCCALCASNGV